MTFLKRVSCRFGKSDHLPVYSAFLNHQTFLKRRFSKFHKKKLSAISSGRKWNQSCLNRQTFEPFTVFDLHHHPFVHHRKTFDHHRQPLTLNNKFQSNAIFMTLISFSAASSHILKVQLTRWLNDCSLACLMTFKFIAAKSSIVIYTVKFEYSCSVRNIFNA